MSVFAAAEDSEHTLFFMHQVARLADTALLAGGGNFRAGALTEALRIQARGWTGRKAVGVAAMGRALQSYSTERDS